MNIKSIIKKHMIPFLSEYQFINIENPRGAVIFAHEENPEIKIYCIVEKRGDHYGITVELRRDNTSRSTSYRLSYFLDKPEDMDSTGRDEYWYFDTEEELTGALEEQANLLKNIAFDWLFKRSDFDLNAMLQKNAKERERIHNSSSEYENQLRIEKLKNEAKEWRNRRVKPVNWG